jgi:hypothetical protein
MSKHFYLSTACLHDLHDKCRKACKYCGSGCQCSCHGSVEAGEALRAEIIPEEKMEILPPVKGNSNDPHIPAGRMLRTRKSFEERREDAVVKIKPMSLKPEDRMREIEEEHERILREKNEAYKIR